MSQTVLSAPPARFRQNEARGRAIAKPLLRATGISPEVDERLMQRLGMALLERDELGAAVAEAMQLPPGDPDRVTHAQLAAALDAAPEVSDDTPPALRAFLSLAMEAPEWVDWARIERGAAAYGYLGRTAHDVLLNLSLIGGYRFGGPADLLVLTGGLAGDNTLRRLAESEQWTNAATTPGGMRVGAEGWRLTLHVRVMHALVNMRFEKRWETARFGLPINQADQAGTLGLFDATVILGCQMLGVPVSRQQRDDLMHLWRYIGWLMGVDPDFLTDDEQERHRINYHVLLTAGDQTPAGQELARLTLDTQAQRNYGHANPRLEHWHQRYARARAHSLLSAVVGKQSMRELAMPMRPPWAAVAAVVGNSLRYRTLSALPGGRRRLETRGRRVQDQILAGSLASHH
ncbi:DUF2236 domain-containing protein [Flexivirga sp. ID2601S]|uniref:DUF2236 domain-containing protein n=1 Tax=Flexivirga aerilata TaxID=1656889 RepID=A0A849AK40_9MICO|nr:oxygenase MpaB family protein [Flexivirga aerilata]NNG39671.1 DUF2236 domain-containing protein [Flexivirga aerilata]